MLFRGTVGPMRDNGLLYVLLVIVAVLAIIWFVVALV